jgi:hypothetical protein
VESQALDAAWESGSDFVAFPLEGLPPLQPWSNGVLNACRAQRRVVDIDGSFVALGNWPWPGVQPAESETAQEDITRRRVVNEWPGGRYKGWLGAALMFAGVLGWSTGVFGTLSQPGQLGGATALLFWLMTIPIAWTLSVRGGFHQPPSDLRVLAVRTLLVNVGAFALLFFVVPASSFGSEALAWMLALLGIGMYLLVGFRRRKVRVRSRDLSMRVVRTMVWATLLFTTLWVLSPGLRELLDGLHHRNHDATSLEDSEEE